MTLRIIDIYEICISSDQSRACHVLGVRTEASLQVLKWWCAALSTLSLVTSYLYIYTVL